MGLRIYNSMTGQKEEFIPRTPGKAGIYWCGLTVYDRIHIGHTMAFIALDIIYRYLTYKGFEVTAVRNHTDIDDKIIKRGNEKGVDPLKLAEDNIKLLEEDCAKLKLLKPTIEPRATKHIPEMIKMITVLIEKGHAYVVDGDVYYKVRSFKEYGKLSKKNIEELEVGARIAIDERKKDALDFALWKASKPGEPKWVSPWGEGRPGWHIECSCMAQKYLGETFDIHGGGRDLIFPHHENEIAQSEGANEKPFAKYWVHNGLLNLDKEKMSKSLGNIITTNELLKKYPAEVIRFFILSAHYRSPIHFSEKLLKQAIVALERLYETRESINEKLKSDTVGGEITEEGSVVIEVTETFRDKFIEAMDDDFNTAQALGHLFELIRNLNRWINTKEFKLTEESKKHLLRIDNLIRECGGIIGLLQNEPAEILRELKVSSLPFLEITEDEINSAIANRDDARRKKDFKVADEIRSRLLKRYILLEDKPGGTFWKIKRELPK